MLCIHSMLPFSVKRSVLSHLSTHRYVQRSWDYVCVRIEIDYYCEQCRELLIRLPIDSVVFRRECTSMFE